MVMASTISAAMAAARPIAHSACDSMPSNWAVGNADEHQADHLAGVAEHRLIGGDEAAAEQYRRTLVGLAAADHGLRRMIGGELGADRAVAVLLLQVGSAAKELLAGVVIDEHRGHAADIADRPVDDFVVGEFRHLRDIDALDHAVLQRDPGVSKAFAEGKAERAQIDVDVAQRAFVEVAAQRPVAGAGHQRGIDRDQQRRAEHGLGPEIKSQQREAASRDSKRHSVSPKSIGTIAKLHF